MHELQTFWAGRSPRQKLAIFGGFAAGLLLTLAFVFYASRVPKSLLYAGLEDARAAPIIAHLEQNGIAYDLRNGSIWVDSRERDRVRMDMAAQNLPQQGGAGYEILDDMSGFSTTSQMFDAAYWRAKEGELARTILSIPSIQSARVHLTPPQSRGYRLSQPGAASVTVVTDGQPVSSEQANAMRFLISSAVPQLQPDAVSVIDSARGLVAPRDKQNSSDREARMKENVERILAPHVGAGNAIVEVSIALVTQSEQLVERSFDPTQRAMISEENEELVDESSKADGGAVTAASNLPEQAGEDGDTQQSQRSETRQRANYEVGSVTRQVDRLPGDIRRLSVAVLVNGVPRENADGTTQIEPRSDQELETIRDLVAAAVGYDETRQDEITVRSMPFVNAAQDGTRADRSGGLVDRLELGSLARLAVIGFFALGALALAMRGLRMGGMSAGGGLDETVPPVSSAMGISDMRPLEPADSDAIPMIAMASPDFDFDDDSTQDADPVARLRRLMKERQDETVRLLNGWIGEDERPAI
ncbi:flagellar basal-body MS-ring/collar protein FliF [Paracoccus aerodenitrificans]|uniref:flagellar basal-body MS-ring/collar protein FliF n=1 Tax=Paracoccus aerodenitrificans TaxID=3017781 RepID=UPI0022F01E59|nr:flagellar basal-body MS-ring/collar protein FliF [Paracoccus aerodenitrificans]WBU63953.1 flagellar basal-body MS-ring/collar protein FliF [Paracoccus aerodenitrificans]